MTKYNAYRTREDGFLIVVFRDHEIQTNTTFLLDPWKVGIRDFDIYIGSLDELKNQLGLHNIELYSIDLENAFNLIVNNLEITKKLKQNLSKRLTDWITKFDILKIPHQGSLYKCFNCEIEDLKENEIENILKVVKKEIKTKVIGTDKEEQYYYVCDTCKMKLHSNH